MKRNLFVIAMVMFFSQFLRGQQSFVKTDFTRLTVQRNISTIGNSLFYKDTTLTKEYYWEKSKNQRTAAWVMLGGGVAISIVGIIGVSSNFDIYGDNSTEDTYAVVTLIGTGLALGSIPLFLASRRNARKAATVSFKTQPVFLPQQNSFVRKAQPTISIDIPL